MEDREVVEDLEETEKPRPFLKLKDINSLLEHPEIPENVEIFYDEYEEKTNHKFQNKMTGLLHKWKLSPQSILKTLKKDFCGLCFIPFPSVDIALIHYKGPIHSLSMEDLKVSGHPDLWKIVLRAVEMKEPHGAYQEDIYQMMVEQYEINRFLSTKEIIQKIGEILRDMEVKHNCLNKEGKRYMLMRNVTWEKELARFFVSTMGEREGRDRGRWESDRNHHVGRREEDMKSRKRRHEEDKASQRRMQRHRSTPVQSPYQHFPTPPHSRDGSLTPQDQRYLPVTPTHSFPSPSSSPFPSPSSSPSPSP